MIRSDEPVFVGIDIGTSKICALVGHVDSEGRTRVIGVGQVPSAGMRKGGVVSLEALARAVATVKDKAERTSGYEIDSALVSLSGSHISSVNSSGMAGVSGRTITIDDVTRALEAAGSIAIPYNREIVHVVPRGYVVDGQDGIKSAIGMHGYRLEVEAHIVTASSTALRNIQKCVEAAGIRVDGWVVSSLAAGEVVLTETEREMGVIVCDLGGGTCDLAVYIEGAVWHTAVIPVGGDHLTNDVAQGLHLPAETAEIVKQRHGIAKRSMVDDAQAFAVRPFGQEGTVNIQRSELAAILEPRVEELFSLVRQEIKRSGYDGLLPAGLVLTGGSSQLPGMREVAAEVLELPVRTAAPENLRGLVDQLQTPAYSASIGLMDWAELKAEQVTMDGNYNGGFSLSSFNLANAAEFIRRLLPG
ncbi:MAG: cell division protein FtsA [Anaerolineales bacterium]